MSKKSHIGVRSRELDRDQEQVTPPRSGSRAAAPPSRARTVARSPASGDRMCKDGRVGALPLLEVRMPREHATSPAPCCIGIDVGKHELAIHALPSGEHWTSPTTARALRALATRLASLHPVVIVVEATGG